MLTNLTFDKFSKTCQKGNLEPQKVENWTAVACTELQKQPGKKGKGHWNEEK